ncbi:FAS1-like dehydratase domain-containing protein [Rhodovibrionaceae bacterium A322]
MAKSEQAVDWSDWIGKSETLEDLIDLNRAAAMRATVESEDPAFSPGDGLPPLWHWCYFWSLANQSTLGPDGHAARGEFLPPIELPRRMWAGSRVSWHKDLPVGEQAKKISTIKNVSLKEGRSGPLAFVTVEHQVEVNAEVVLTEEHDIVYREAAKPGDKAPDPVAAPAQSDWRRQITPDPVLLFRYSALTFNGHRIHYDQPYVTGEEGYPGLIVHGPLLATLMVDLARRNAKGRRIAAFSFRALSPVFDLAPFVVCGDDKDSSADVWIEGSDGQLCMKGAVQYG